MHDHSEIRALAAAAIDFELDPDERARLNEALESCSLCRRQASAMRATATVLRRPSDIGTPNHVRDVVIGAALRRGRRTPRFGSLLAASLSLLLALAGTAVIVGNRGFGILLPESPTPESLVQTASPQASPTPSPTTVEPAPAPSGPTATAVAPSPTVDGTLRAGEIAAMVTDGRLVIRTLPKTGADSAIFKTRIHPGQRVLALEGPVDASGYSWYRIRLGVIEGWAAAAGLDGTPWLAPVRNGLIAFVRDAGDGIGESINTIRADGTTDEAVFLADPNLVHYEQLTWSPDGRRLAFVGSPAGSIDAPSEIFVVDADGSNLVPVTQNQVYEDSLAWSPDSTRIAYAQPNLDPSQPDRSTVVVMRADGSAMTVLGPGANPAWSPDGLQLAMTVSASGSSRIWVQAPDGANRRQVADVAVASAPPAWSPDGQDLVASSSGLFLVEVASGSITPLTSEPGATPIWSAGGTIAFSTPGSASPGIFTISPNGTGLKRIPGGQGAGMVPSWAPDGRRILLDEGGGSRVAIVDPDNGNLTPVPSESGTSRSPAWQPFLP